MNQIPLHPLDREPEPLRQSRAMPEPPRPRRSIFGKLWGGVRWVGSTPALWFGTESVREGATVIAGLVGRVRARPRRDLRFRTDERGVFDLQATAFSCGISVAELERRLLLRRRQTALTAYVLAGFAVLFFGAWLSKVLAAEGTGQRVLLTVDLLPFCLLFALLAFYQALINFQIRTGRTAGWREYLTTDTGFWPRP